MEIEVQQNVSILEMVNMIIGQQAWTESAKSKLHRQMKHWRASRLLTPLPICRDGRNTDVFDYYAIFRARLLMVLADIGLDVDDMDSALDGIAPRPDHMLVSYENREQVMTPAYNDDRKHLLEWHFDTVVDNLRLDNSFEFDCYVSLSRDCAGFRNVSAQIAPRLHNFDNDHMDTFNRNQGRVAQAEIVIPLSNLLRPLVGAVDA